MRHLAVAGVLALAACTDRGTPPEPPAPRDRPLALDGSTARAITSTPDRVKVQLDLAAVRGAIREYRAARDAWPSSLAELQVPGLNYPADLAYDPASGTVTSRTYASF